MTLENILTSNLKVLVFRSDIDTPQKAHLVQTELQKTVEVYRVDVDLEDSENVLRVECHPGYRPKLIERRIAELGLACSEFTDY